jgi:hypothetical protein
MLPNSKKKKNLGRHEQKNQKNQHICLRLVILRVSTTGIVYFFAALWALTPIGVVRSHGRFGRTYYHHVRWLKFGQSSS